MKGARAITLVELMVSVAVISLFAGMLAWFLKGVTVFRLDSQKRLKLAEVLQRNLFFIQNDLMSVKRHTMGNLLCSNITFRNQNSGMVFNRTTSDPGFDEPDTEISRDPNDNIQWFAPLAPMVPMNMPGQRGHAYASINRDPQTVVFGKGNLLISSSSVDPFSVRSPRLENLDAAREYVLAGWIRGEASLTCSISLVSGAAQIVSTGTVANIDGDRWVYRSATVLVAGRPAGPYEVNLTAVNTIQQSAACYFDNITVTPATVIADMNFDVARSFNPNTPFNEIDLNVNPNIGMVFIQTNPDTGNSRQMKYVYCGNTFLLFPPSKPTIQRFTSIPPEFDRHQNFFALGGAPQAETTLRDVRRITVSWLDVDGRRGAQRPLTYTITVQDPANENATMNFSQTVFPPTE